MSTTYVNFTPAERERVRATDLAEFLRRQGYDLKREGRGFIWMNGGEKVSIQGNLWYNQYTRKGGDAIDFARRFFDCTDYPSAVRFLLGADVGVAVINPQKQEKKKEQKPFALPPANPDMHRIYVYRMKQRGIDRDVIRAFTHAKLLYEEATYHNCVFVGYDENGIARHAHKRGTTTGSSFKCNADGSNPQYSFHWSGTSERLFVFEAPIDMMSYITWLLKSRQIRFSVEVGIVFAKVRSRRGRACYACFHAPHSRNDAQRGKGEHLPSARMGCIRNGKRRKCRLPRVPPVRTVVSINPTVVLRSFMACRTERNV